jgi:hypothetical protein
MQHDVAWIGSYLLEEQDSPEAVGSHAGVASLPVDEISRSPTPSSCDPTQPQLRPD